MLAKHQNMKRWKQIWSMIFSKKLVLIMKLFRFFSNEFGKVEIEIKCSLSNLSETKKIVMTLRKIYQWNCKSQIARRSKSIYLERVIFRRHRDTRFERTRDAKSILKKKPTKRFRNTYCPFQISIKIPKEISAESKFCCSIVFEHKHNHAVNSLYASSFNMWGNRKRHQAVIYIWLDPIDFNAMYAKFCVDKFGGKNGPEFFVGRKDPFA